VSKLRFKISMSLDGFVAGPSQSVEHPLGIGGGGTAVSSLESNGDVENQASGDPRNDS